MPVIEKSVKVKKKNEYSITIGDKVMLNSELESFYKEFIKNVQIWDNFSFFEKAKIIAYIAIIIKKNEEVEINEDIIKSFENRNIPTDIVTYLKNSIQERNKLLQQIEALIEQLEEIYKLHQNKLEKIKSQQDGAQNEKIHMPKLPQNI